MDIKKCPYCAEDIKAEAIKCKHCQSDLSGIKFDGVMPYGKSAQEVASGIKKAEWDKEQLKAQGCLGIFIAFVAAVYVGSTTRTATGVVVFFLIAIIWQFIAWLKYYKK